MSLGLRALQGTYSTCLSFPFLSFPRARTCFCARSPQRIRRPCVHAHAGPSRRRNGLMNPESAVAKRVEGGGGVVVF